METSNGNNSDTVKDRAKMFAPKRGFSGSGNLMVPLKFVPHWPSLLWQPTDCFWAQN